MKKISTLFLQAIIILMGIGVLILMLWEPHLEGRNVNATPFEIYFKDPFLAYVYFSSIPFFVGLYQVFKVLRYIGQNELSSPHVMQALRTIKYCATTTAVFVLGAEAYFFIVQRGKEDIAGGVAVGGFIILVSLVVASLASLLESTLQKAIDIKSKNDVNSIVKTD